MDLIGKYALVTGATKGIGRATVLELASQGCNVAFNSRNHDQGIALEEYLKKQYSAQKFFYHRCDVASQDSILEYCTSVKINFHSTLDYLINNAGLYSPGDTITSQISDHQHLINTNLLSAIAFTNHFVNLMISHKKGHIINICSVASLIALPNSGNYCISKFALYGYTKVLRQELSNHNIKVTAVLPGATWSDSWSGVQLPLDRLIKAEDIAKAIVSTLVLSPSATVEEILIRPQLGDL